MSDLVTAYQKTAARLDGVLKGISAVLVGLCAAAMLYSVLGRYVFQETWEFVEETTKDLMMYSTFLVTPVVLRAGRQVRVDVLPNILKGRALQVVNLLAAVCSLAAAVYLLLSAIVGFIFQWKSGAVSVTEIAIPLWTKFVPFTVCSGLILIYSLEYLFSTLTKLTKKTGE